MAATSASGPLNDACNSDISGMTQLTAQKSVENLHKLWQREAENRSILADITYWGCDGVRRHEG
jgi:hypothetical protein